MKFLILFLIGIVLISLCSQEIPQDIKQQAIDACTSKCNDFVNSQGPIPMMWRGTFEEYLNTGPCLGDPLLNFTDWVCDIAHSPRQPEIDDKPENQCSAYREGLATHFVEVDTSCNLITSR
jgi:uncharacterized membrane protein